MKRDTLNIASNQISYSIWSVDRIARLIVGVLNTILALATYFISPYFLIGLSFLNLNLIYTSVTDKCFLKKLLIRLGAKEREKFFDSNGKLISPSKENNFADKLRDFENQFITLPIKEKQ